MSQRFRATSDYQDHYFHRAKKERYLARAVYKLEEIQNKHHLLHPGDRVLDLGAAPGSWMQLTSRVIGPKGLLVGVDMRNIDHPFPGHVVVVQGDIFDRELMKQLATQYAPFDVLLSDMAPATSGIRVADSARSALLFERALELVPLMLKSQGHFLAKIFQGQEFHELLTAVKRFFSRVKVVKPDASRKTSREIYVLGMHLKNS